MDEVSVANCIARINNGDTAAYTAIVDAYKQMAYTIALKILHNADDAEDVSQEAFIKAYQQLRQFKGNSKFSTWLYTIVYRTALARSKENKIPFMTLSTAENYEDKSAALSTPMEQLEEQRFIKTAIDRLGETDALLVTLYYMNENTVSEISQITGLSMPNIKIRLFRARKKLERELQVLIQHDKPAVNG